MQGLKTTLKFTNLEKINPLFSRADVRIAYTDLNRNNSFIPESAFIDAIPTMYGIPIVGEYLENKTNFGDHGGEIQWKDGEPHYVQTTVPYGFVPESANVYWQDVEEDNGETHKYLCADSTILWTGRYPELDIMVGKTFNQSMEIIPVEEEWVEIDGSKVQQINKFIFSAFCVLGTDYDGKHGSTDVEPCFESASITTYSLNKDQFKEEFSLMLKEFKKSVLEFEDDKQSTIKIDNSKDSANMNGEWGNVDKSSLYKKIKNASNAKSLFKEAYLISDVPENIEDATQEDMKYPHHEIVDGKLIVHKAGCEAALQRLHQQGIYSGKAIDHLKKHYRALKLDMSSFTVHDDKQFSNKEVKELQKSKKEIAAQFKLTTNQMYEELNRVLCKMTYIGQDWYGQACEKQHYYLRDYDDSYVYVVDTKEGYMDMKIPYSMQGDNVVIDYENASRIKYTPMDWEGGESEGEDDEVEMGMDKYVQSMEEDAKKEMQKMKDEYTEKEQEFASKEQEYESKVSEYEAKLQEHQETVFSATSKLESVNAEIEQLKSQLTELEQFKFAKLDQEKQEKVSALIEENSRYFSVDEVDEWRNKGKECESFDTFERDFKLAAFSKIKDVLKEDKHEKLFAFVDKNEDKQDDDSDVFSKLKNKFDK